MNPLQILCTLLFLMLFGIYFISLKAIKVYFVGVESKIESNKFDIDAQIKYILEMLKITNNRLEIDRYDLEQMNQRINAKNQKVIANKKTKVKKVK